MAAGSRAPPSHGVCSGADRTPGRGCKVSNEMPRNPWSHSRFKTVLVLSRIVQESDIKKPDLACLHSLILKKDLRSVAAYKITKEVPTTLHAVTTEPVNSSCNLW